MRTRTTPRRLRVVLTLISAIVLVAVAAVAIGTQRGAGDAETGSEDGSEDRSALRYVALGDSYTAAPYVPATDPDDPCLQSEANYPHLLATAIGELDLTDVSCGGATTVSMLEPQTRGSEEQDPQFDALDEGTDLVTVGIGGNDFALFAALIYACLPPAADGTSCHADSPRDDELQTTIDLIESNVVEVLTGIQERAPQAQIVVVPYPQLLRPDATCADRVPFDAADSAYIGDVMTRLSQAQAAAAKTADVEYVDVLAASRGHDICAQDPWVMGGTTDTAVAASFHPLAAHQEAVATMLRELLCETNAEIPC